MPGKTAGKIQDVNILMNITSARQTIAITGEKLSLANAEVTASSNLLKDTEIFSPVKNPNGTRTMDVTIATGAK